MDLSRARSSSRQRNATVVGCPLRRCFRGDSLALLIGDTAIAAAGFLLLVALMDVRQGLEITVVRCVVVAAGVSSCVLVLRTLGVYSHDVNPIVGAGVRRFALRAGAACFSGWLMLILAAAMRFSVPPERVAIVSVLIAVAGAMWHAFIDGCFKVPERALIIGSGTVATQLAARTHRARCPVHIVGYVDEQTFAIPAEAVRPLGKLDALPAIVAENRIDRVIVAFSATVDAKLVEVVRRCDALGVRVDVVPRFFELLGTDSRTSSVGDLPVMRIGSRVPSVRGRGVKRGIDIAVSGCLLILLAPLMATVAVLIAVSDGMPIIYRQTRIGRAGTQFAILKFRSMYRDADQRTGDHLDALNAGAASISDVASAMKPDVDPRVTPIGRVIRTTSIDELPQLWNVLTGSMSLVGPRPLRPYEVSSLNEWQLARHDVKPGITGLWQVSGRSDIDWDRRMQLDYVYARQGNGYLDLTILAETLPSVLRGDGAR